MKKIHVTGGGCQVNLYGFIAAAIFAFTSGGIFGNKNAICSRMFHDAPATGWTAFP